MQYDPRSRPALAAMHGAAWICFSVLSLQSLLPLACVSEPASQVEIIPFIPHASPVTSLQRLFWSTDHQPCPAFTLQDWTLSVLTLDS